MERLSIHSSKRHVSLRLTTVKLVSNASISPEVVLGCLSLLFLICIPMISILRNEITTEYVWYKKLSNQENRSLVLRYIPLHLRNATQSNKNRKDGRETKKGVRRSLSSLYSFARKQHSSSLCYLYPLVNVQTLLPMKQISKGISYDKTDRVAQDECDSFFLALSNVGEFNPLNIFVEKAKAYLYSVRKYKVRLETVV